MSSIQNITGQTESPRSQLQRSINPAAAMHDNAMAMQNNFGDTTKMVDINDGMTEAEILIERTPMMNNARVVDDKNDTTAAVMNAPAVTQWIPNRFSMDIWQAFFTSNLFIERISLGGDTAINYQIFEYSSDPNSVNFPNLSAALAFLKNLLLGHKFYVADFRIKVKLISAMGTVGRIIVAVLPDDYQIPVDIDATVAIKSSGYDYAEISADGDSTYVVSLRPYVNSGFANVGAAPGVGQISENTRVVAYVSELFRTTFSETPPDITITTEFSFGQAFQLSVPLTTLPTLLGATAQEVTRNFVTPQARGYPLGRDTTLRIGSRRFAELDYYVSSSYSLPYQDFLASSGPPLSFKDAFLAIPCKSTIGGTTVSGYFPIFRRGVLTPNLLVSSSRNENVSLTDWLFTQFSDQAVECYILGDIEGNRDIDLTFADLDPELVANSNNMTHTLTLNKTVTDYYWRVIVVRDAINYCVLAFPSNYGQDEIVFDSNGFLNFPADPLGAYFLPLTTYSFYGPTFMPPYNGQFSTSPTDVIVLPTLYSPQLDDQSFGDPPTYIILQTIQSNASDNLYPSLTFENSSFATRSPIGYGAVPNDMHRRLVDFASMKGYAGRPCTFDLTDSNGILIAHCLLTSAKTIQVNISDNFVYRTISGDIFVTNLVLSSGLLLPTPSNSWSSYFDGTATKLIPRFKPRFDSLDLSRWDKAEVRENRPPITSRHVAQAAIAGMLGGGLLSGLGNAMSQNSQNRFELEKMDKNNEYQRGLMEQGYGYNKDMVYLNNDLGNKTIELQSGLNYNNASALSAQSAQQQVRNEMLMTGMGDPSSLGKPTSHMQSSFFNRQAASRIPIRPSSSASRTFRPVMGPSGKIPQRMSLNNFRNTSNA